MARFEYDPNNPRPFAAISIGDAVTMYMHEYDEEDDETWMVERQMEITSVEPSKYVEGSWIIYGKWLEEPRVKSVTGDRVMQ